MINVDIATKPHSNKFANASAPFNYLIRRFCVVTFNHAKETRTDNNLLSSHIRVAAVNGEKCVSSSLQPGQITVCQSIPPPSSTSSAGSKPATLRTPDLSSLTAGTANTPEFILKGMFDTLGNELICCPAKKSR